jgi:hypothetical protein
LANSLVSIGRLFRLSWRNKPNKKHSSDYLKLAESNDLAKSREADLEAVESVYPRLSRGE